MYGTPENIRAGQAAEAIAMTAPVLMGSGSGHAEQIAMTAPVVMGNRISPAGGQQSMQFNLPSKYKTIDECPRPTNPSIHVQERCETISAALTFSGAFDEKNIDEKGSWLLAAVLANGLKPCSTSDKPFYCAGFNPPFTPNMLKTNEVYIDLEVPEQYSPEDSKMA